jgi:hypothetical protein
MDMSRLAILPKIGTPVNAGTGDKISGRHYYGSRLSDSKSVVQEIKVTVRKLFEPPKLRRLSWPRSRPFALANTTQVFVEVQALELVGHAEQTSPSPFAGMSCSPYYFNAAPLRSLRLAECSKSISL